MIMKMTIFGGSRRFQHDAGILFLESEITLNDWRGANGADQELRRRSNWRILIWSVVILLCVFLVVPRGRWRRWKSQDTMLVGGIQNRVSFSGEQVCKLFLSMVEDAIHDFIFHLVNFLTCIIVIVFHDSCRFSHQWRKQRLLAVIVIVVTWILIPEIIMIRIIIGIV